MCIVLCDYNKYHTYIASSENLIYICKLQRTLTAFLTHNIIIVLLGIRVLGSTNNLIIVTYQYSKCLNGGHQQLKYHEN